MLVLSTVLVDIVKSFVTNKSELVCLTASHYGTVGTVLKTERKYMFRAEEDLFKVVVREAVDVLNQAGYNVEQTGIDEHEQSFNTAYYRKYSVVISNHFDYAKGERATLYTNEILARKINDIRNRVSPVKASVLRYRPELQIPHMHNAVILEWFKSTDQWAVDALLSQSNEGPNRTPERPTRSKYGILKEYEETGRFTCKEKAGIVGYKEAELINRVPLAQDLAYDEYTDYNHVYYIVDIAGRGYVVVRSVESGNFFPIRNYSRAIGFGKLWGNVK